MCKHSYRSLKQASSIQVDFGCILNDTETVHYVKMINNSPLEVHYKWYFLRRPPVRREDPEQMDEGVDMQSECETDSLTEAGGQVDGEEGGQGEEEEEECEEEEEEQDGEGDGESEETGEGVEGEEVEEQEEEEAEEGEGKEGREEEREEEEGDDDVFDRVSGRGSEQSQLTGSGIHARPVREEEEGDSQDSKPDLPASQQIVSSTGFSEPEEGQRPQGSSEAPESLAESYATPDKPPESVGEGTEEPQLPHPAGGDRKQQPWELVEDPFTPLSIEQV